MRSTIDIAGDVQPVPMQCGYFTNSIGYIDWERLSLLYAQYRPEITVVNAECGTGSTIAKIM